MGSLAPVTSLQGKRGLSMTLSVPQPIMASTDQPPAISGDDRFRQIADSAPVPMWVTGLDRKRSFVNRAYMAFAGLDYADACALDWQQIIHPEDIERIAAQSLQGEASLKPFTLEGRFRRGDGEWRWLHSVSQPSFDEGGCHNGFIGVAYDMTESQRAQTVQRERAAQYAAFISQSTAGFGQVDLEGRFTLVNERFCEIVGRSREELLGITMQSITHPADLPRNQQMFERSVADGTPYQHEKRYIRPDGSIVWVSNSVSLIRKGNGEPYGVLAIVIDITARKQVEEKFTRAAESVRLAIEGAGMATWELNLDTLEGEWSPSRFDILGLAATPDGRGSLAQWVARVHPDDRERAESALRLCLAEGTPLRIDYRIYRADTGEERWLQSSGSRIDDSALGGARFVGVSFDITERKRSEAHMLLLINELNHRVKNTLSIVQGIAKQSFASDNGSAEALSAFDGRIAALAAAHDILTRENWAPSSMASLIHEVLGPHLERPGAFHLSGRPLSVSAKTAVTLALAIHELATNATKHGALTTPEGRIHLYWCVDDRNPDAPQLVLEWRESGGPPVVVPQQRGFGTRMIERALAAELGGTVKIDFNPEGLVCTVVAPLPEGSQ